MKNILLIRSNLNLGEGPTNTIIATIEELKKRKYNVFLTCGGGTAIQSAIDAGAFAKIFEELSYYGRTLLTSIAVIPKIRKYILSNHIDTIYGFNSAASLVAYFATIGKHREIRIGNALLGRGKEQIHKMMPFKHVCMSDAQKEDLIRHGLKAENITTIHPSTINPERFDFNKYDRKKIREDLGLPDNAVVIGNVMNGGKGRNDFSELIKKVCDENKDTYWLFVGTSKKYEIYKQFLTDTRYKHRCLFLGHRLDIPEIMCVMDILSHNIENGPGIRETFGQVLTEAMSMHTPVVASNFGGMTEIIENNVTGFLVDDDTAYLESINLLCKNSELRKSMAEKSYERAVTLFSQEKYGDELEAFLKCL